MGVHIINSYNFGAPPLSISITSNSPGEGAPLELVDAGGATVVSSAGAIDLLASASGGTAPYSFQWALSERSDNGNVTIHTTGTQNVANYNTARLQSVLAASGNPPNEAIYRFECEVTDGAGETENADVDIIIVSIGL